MSWKKIWKPEKIYHYPGTMEVEKYIYTPGIHGKEFFDGLKKGKIYGMECDNVTYVPPKTFCPDGKRGKLVDLTSQEWVLETYTIVRSDIEGRELSKPKIIGVVRPENALGGLIHYIDVDEKDIFIGMPLKPVFRPVKERKGSIRDLLYFTKK